METREVKLGDIVKYNKGYAFKSSEYTDEGVMVVRVTDFTLDSISDVDAVYLAPDDRYDKFILKTNDILIQTVGSWENNPNSIVGKVVRVPNQCDSAYLNQNIVRIIPNNDFNNTYLFYALKANQFSTYCVLRGQGAANQASITLDTIFRFKFKAHNFAEQKRIADIMSAYDNLIENNNKRIKLLEQMAENLYKEWFVRFRFPGYEDVEFENGIPKGWKIESLSDIADIIMGQSPESENYNTNCIGLPFHQGVGSYGDFYLIDGVYSTKGNRIAEANSIIFSVRAPVGRINITLNKIILGRGVAGINSVKGYNAYLLWMLKNRFQQEDIIGNGSIFASVTKKELFGFKMFMPNEDLIQKFDSIASGIESVMRNISLINSNLKKQRDMLLPRLMSGKLEV